MVGLFRTTWHTEQEGGEGGENKAHLARVTSDYFDRVNCATPIFDREAFDVELHTFYQPGSRPSAAWLLSFYMILALGCISEPCEESVVLRTANQAEALSFFRAGCGLIPIVLFCNRDISGVQALLATVTPPLAPSCRNR